MSGFGLSEVFLRIRNNFEAAVPGILENRVFDSGVVRSWMEGQHARDSMTILHL